MDISDVRVKKKELIKTIERLLNDFSSSICVIDDVEIEMLKKYSGFKDQAMPDQSFIKVSIKLVI